MQATCGDAVTVMKGGLVTKLRGVMDHDQIFLMTLCDCDAACAQVACRQTGFANVD
jgi:hypothetical protein